MDGGGSVSPPRHYVRGRALETPSSISVSLPGRVHTMLDELCAASGLGKSAIMRTLIMAAHQRYSASGAIRPVERQ